MEDDEFWERPEIVARFGDREPDHRLLALVYELGDPASVRVLDLGCAGGRNAALLAARGFDLHAVDGSMAMVARARERVADILGAEEAERRVIRGSMDDLSAFAASSFALVVALGIYHSARSRPMWERSLDESARVLAPGGLLLVAHFAPRTDPTGDGTRAVPGEPGVYDGMQSGRHVFVEAAELDAAAASRGLAPAVASEARTDGGRRVTVNALYRKSGSPLGGACE